MPTSPNRGAGAYVTGDPEAYHWGWLAMVGAVIVMMITGAGWLYQKRGEWRIGAADDARTLASENVPQLAITRSTFISAVDGASSPSGISSASTPARKPDAAIAESSMEPEPPAPLPLTMVNTGAERSAQHVGSVSLVHEAETASIPSSTYLIRRGDTLMAIAAHHYGDAFQWTVIAQANPDADPRRLRVGQEIQLPPGSSQSRQVP